MKKFLEKINYSSLFFLALSGLFFHSLTLSLANTVGYKLSSSGILWSHWIGLIGWALPTFIGYKLLTSKVNVYAKLLFPVASLLSGIGILTIWRINSDLGFRQTLIYAFTVFFLCGILHKIDLLKIIRKWIFLVLLLAILLLAGSLFFGVNPGGFGPSLWIGCCGIYLQPSEPLKIILLLILAFYLPTTLEKTNKWEKYLWFPGIFLVIFLILLVQRDLGTGTIFLILTFSILAIYLNKPGLLSIFGLGLLTAGLAGYFTVPLIKTRIDTWLSPWQDPTNSGYQIIQSLISIANGGLNGRGPGLGYPSLVPVAFSDFIFTAISEEMGLVGAILILSLIGFFIFLAFSIAKQTNSIQYRLLASGIGVYIGAQSIIIIGGNINLFPLTGVTLPYISYGGSSLFSSFFALTLLIAVSNESESLSIADVEQQSKHQLNLWILNLIFLGLLICGFSLGYWSLIKGEELLSRTDNPRRSINDLYSKRGMIVDRNNQVLVATIGEKGNYQRNYIYPFLSPILGYTHPTYGQSNIEESYDEYLRGERGQPDLKIWWEHLVYGRPPDGLNIRTTIDLIAQQKLVDFFDDQPGSAVLITPNNGELIAAISVPYVDLNQPESYIIEDKGENSHLINRVSLGKYPSSLVMSIFQDSDLVGELPVSISQILYERDLFHTPEIGFETSENLNTTEYLNPLQIVSLFSGFSNNGNCADLKFISAVQIVNNDWIILPSESRQQECYSNEILDKLFNAFRQPNNLFWSTDQFDPETKTYLYVAGTDTNWSGTPLTLVLVLENVDQDSRKDDIDRLVKQMLLNK